VDARITPGIFGTSSFFNIGINVFLGKQLQATGILLQ